MRHVARCLDRRGGEEGDRYIVHSTVQAVRHVWSDQRMTPHCTHTATEIHRMSQYAPWSFHRRPLR